VRIDPVQLSTPGLVLRAPRPEDGIDALAMLRDPDVAVWNPAPHVVDVATAQDWCRRGADWSAGDHATFTIVLAASGRLVGNISLFQINAAQASASVGYRVAPWYRNRGAATASLRAVALWAFTELGLFRIELCHAVANPASCQVATKAGFLLEGRLRSSMVYGDGERHDEHLHARLAAD
jgi:RimJ/RimL family protein N-acetyltransferase